MVMDIAGHNSCHCIYGIANILGKYHTSWAHRHAKLHAAVPADSDGRARCGGAECLDGAAADE